MASPQSVATFQSVPPRPNPPSALNRPLTEDEFVAAKAFDAASAPAPVTATATGGKVVDGIPIAKDTLPAGGLKDVPAGASPETTTDHLARIADTLQGRSSTPATPAGQPEYSRSIAELRKVAAALGVDTKGTKAQLSERIAEALAH